MHALLPLVLLSAYLLTACHASAFQSIKMGIRMDYDAVILLAGGQRGNFEVRVREVLRLANDQLRPHNVHLIVTYFKTLRSFSPRPGSSLEQSRDLLLGVLSEDKDYSLDDLPFDFFQVWTGKSFHRPNRPQFFAAANNKVCDPMTANALISIVKESGEVLEPKEITHLLLKSLVENMGMSDGRFTCLCPADGCVTSPGSTRDGRFYTSLPDCFEDFVDKRFDHMPCTRSEARMTPKSVPICGNGQVEAGEGCDCHLRNNTCTRCCNMLFCQPDHSCTQPSAAPRATSPPPTTTTSSTTTTTTPRPRTSRKTTRRRRTTTTTTATPDPEIEDEDDPDFLPALPQPPISFPRERSTTKKSTTSSSTTIATTTTTKPPTTSSTTTTTTVKPVSESPLPSQTPVMETNGTTDAVPADSQLTPVYVGVGILVFFFVGLGIYFCCKKGGKPRRRRLRPRPFVSHLNPSHGPQMPMPRRSSSRSSASSPAQEGRQLAPRVLGKKGRSRR